jgi:hypothetical protein
MEHELVIKIWVLCHSRRQKGLPTPPSVVYLYVIVFVEAGRISECKTTNPQAKYLRPSKTWKAGSRRILRF